MKTTVVSDNLIVLARMAPALLAVGHGRVVPDPVARMEEAVQQAGPAREAPAAA